MVLRATVKTLKEIGLDGIEAGYPTHDESMVKFALDLADEFNLLISRGSDDHGEGIRKVKVMGPMKAEIPIDKIWIL